MGGQGQYGEAPGTHGLAVRGLTCRRGGRTVFEGVGFALVPGDVGIVTGPNGIGKSSLLRIVAGLLPPHAGDVVRGAGPVAYLGEASALDADRSLIDALAFWAMLDGIADPHDRVEHAIDALDLAPLADLPVRMLSTGQRRRAGLARVVATQAAFWLLDEPANGLDDAAVARLAELIAAHRSTGGIALVATHLPLPIARAVGIALGRP